MDFEKKIELIFAFAEEMIKHKDNLIKAAIKDIGFTYKDTIYEFEITISRLKSFKNLVPLLQGREPLCKQDEEVALILPYNGSSWLNIAILSVYLAGNKVRVKFSSKSPRITKLIENIYNKIFGDAIKFDYRHGKEFMKYAIENPKVKAIVAFGSDSTIMPYEKAILNAKKKLIFEGPGNDPFIVLKDANLEEAVRELTMTKYMYSGQACTAPERIYVQEEIYNIFIQSFIEYTKSLKVGDPEDPETDVAPVISKRAVENIKGQLKDAIAKGAKIVYGGKIEGNLVYPTIVVDANHSMLGMQEEIFGPVSYICKFDSPEKVIELARDSKYGLRATIYGKKDAKFIANALKGADYLEEVEEYTFGKFGTLSINEPRSETWKDALVTKPIGGYGYSGWVWDFVDGKFKLKQGPKLFSIETSVAIKS
uniref:Aldehyde dehydrogenase family protein n=1 Tax=Thermodesulfobacterium geofontis TaxID=1295609 RepID=A0A7V4JNX2_9BACT